MPVFAEPIHAALALLSAISFAHVVRAVFSLSALVGLTMFFRPLLTGIARALLLTVRPPLTREERAARRQLDEARVLQRGIHASVADAPELRAAAARA